MCKIWIEEDDESIREELRILLRTNGYEPVDRPPCDLALLDVNLPEENGYEKCRKLRMQSAAPVIFLTARSSAEDELLAFGMGADDYIRKPYHSSVLLARIERLLKRRTASVSAHGMTLRLNDMTVQCGEVAAELTKNETRILYCLLTKELCSKEYLLEELWGNGLYVDENTLYVNIARLREKLREIGGAEIRTVRGVGYKL